MPVKKLGIVVLLIVLSCQVKAQQRSADIGLFVGGGTPLTDFTQTKITESLNFDFGIFYRHNYNSRISLRFNAIYGTMNQTGTFNNQEMKFSKKVFNFDALVEINYLDFIIGVPKMKFSPFVYTGIGLSIYPDIDGNTIVTPSIPLGIGAKYAFNKRIAIGAEASLHKLMNDGLDNLDNPYTNNGLIKVSDIAHNNDWLSYFGLTLTYKFFWGSVPCPIYETIN